MLPHFWFPVGWTATLDGAPVSLERTPLGLMRLSLATPGLLEVRFGATPGRWLGIAVSALVLAMMTFATRRMR